MKYTIATFLIAAGAITACATASFDAQAQTGASAVSAISALPVASVVVGASAVAGSVVAVPLVLSSAGAVLIVKAVEVSARSTVYVLERASDGARVSVALAGGVLASTAMAVGTSVTVTVIGAGVVLSAAGEAIAYIPNALGRALVYNERLTD
jgi:hypothetical protein